MMDTLNFSKNLCSRIGFLHETAVQLPVWLLRGNKGWWWLPPTPCPLVPWGLISAEALHVGRRRENKYSPVYVEAVRPRTATFPRCAQSVFFSSEPGSAVPTCCPLCRGSHCLNPSNAVITRVLGVNFKAGHLKFYRHSPPDFRSSCVYFSNC